MFLTRDRGRRAAGFTLIEVLAALGVLMIVAAALTPQVIAGLRATGVARDLTQAKGVSQARLEQMRAMPYFVGREAGDYIDLLDTYYRNTTAPSVTPACDANGVSALPPTSWTGFVPVAGKHCAWEPTGAMYRTIINPISAPGLGTFSMAINTQFLTAASVPVTPLAGYNSQIAGSDQPAASQVGVTVTVFFKSHQGVRTTSTYTQVERSSPSDPLIESRAATTTVQVSSVARNWNDWMPGDPDPVESTAINDAVNLMATIGVVNLTGELFTGSRVIANVASASGSTSAPSSVSGASTNLTAPVDTPAVGATTGPASLPNGCRWICFGTTTTRDTSAATADGQPRVGTPTAPAQAIVPANSTNHGLWFDNGRWRNRLQLVNNQPMVSLDTSGSPVLPAVSDCKVGGVSVPDDPYAVRATGFLDATHTEDPNRHVQSCATAQAHTVRVFPTSFAPAGVLRVHLDRASAYCRTGSGTTTKATTDYAATVRYWNGSGYTTLPQVDPGNSTDPLAGVDLTQVIHPASGLTLGDYVQSWSSATSADIQERTSAESAQVTLPAVVAIHTGPTRTFATGWGGGFDETSAISLAIGSASCEAVDHR